MVIGAWAGTPLAELQSALDARGQMLAFEPPDYRCSMAQRANRRWAGWSPAGWRDPPVMAGGLRDSLIGVRFVNGRAEAIKNGGRA